MMRRGGAKVALSLMAAAGPRLFSTATTIRASNLLKPSVASAYGMSGSSWIWIRAPAIGGVRFASTVTLGEKTQTQETETEANPKKAEKESTGGNKGDKGIASYWGVEPNKITKEDGSEWKWNCFRVC